MRKEKKTQSYTLYRLSGARELASCVQDKYLKQQTFQSHDFIIEGKSGLFVEGSITTEEAKWVSTAQRLTGVTFKRGNETSAGLIRRSCGPGRRGFYGVRVSRNSVVGSRCRRARRRVRRACGGGR